MNSTSATENFGWDHPNIPAAIGISVGAGLATAVGGALVFFPEALKRVSQQVILAVSLALSAGVMIYVSFIEIYAKSLDAISETEGFTEGGAVAVTTLFFFLGMFVCVLLEVLVHWMSTRGGVNHDEICAAHTQLPHVTKTQAASVAAESATASSAACCDDSGSGGGDGSRKQHSHDHDHADASHAHAHEHSHTPDGECCEHEQLAQPTAVAIDIKQDGDLIGNKAESKALSRMGVMTACAIAIHNFPEGLATFLATVQDTKVGASLGVAIAVHNIPEGLCVAMPIYYATGSKKKAFFWSVLSGITEPIGGILGYAVLQPVFTQLVFGIVFSMVGGMMVFIVCHELLPASHRYMGNSAKTTAWLIFGMAIMALSLVLFVI